ncbi:adenine phosphoribosyltransferase [Muriicola marianensis]|uniref:Adenine phosphoribosyltransferase n=1 Tax=Muriicola marianensis TaxID=1324801 RepID=A0ABQ1R3Z8_9FLAO|nr:adenine phosphoribosyltransferase [Muriicola marianensis]GGD56420.1 adenine phosphoribosyltransferase [Muriicola marianensis]
MDFKQYVRDIEDFPKKGVGFKDITPLLKDPKAFKAAADALLAFIGDEKIDVVVGMESRGFFYGPVLALALNAGFVPVRKVGKLPHQKISHTYDLEYGTDTLEIHADAINPGDRVVIHDDVLATGGTARATCKLIEALGGVVVQCNFLLELTMLHGASKLEGYSVKSLMRY